MRKKVDGLLNLCSHQRGKFVRLDPYEKTILNCGLLCRGVQRFVGSRAVWPDDANALWSERQSDDSCSKDGEYLKRYNSIVRSGWNGRADADQAVQHRCANADQAVPYRCANADQAVQHRRANADQAKEHRGANANQTEKHRRANADQTRPVSRELKTTGSLRPDRLQNAGQA
jgi:hypothetical protein